MLTGGMAQGNSQLYIEILKSRTAAEYIVNKYNLIEFYDVDNEYKASNELRDDLTTELSKEGIITLSVDVSTGLFPLFTSSDSIYQFSADLSNSYVEALDKINREKISYKAKRAREYIEKQLLETKEMLETAEYILMQFRKENKTISLPKQLQVAIESSAKIRAEIIKTEIEIGLLEPNLQEDNQLLISLKKKLFELNQEYKKFETGTEDYLIAFNDVPELSMEFARNIREVKIQNEIYLLLQQQYYKEKIQENRDLPTIEILDKAIKPLKKTAPKTVYSTVLTFIFSFLFISFYFIIKDKKIQILKRENIK
jgi:capsule polysaccharide export protein KpsE/RkpR